METKRLPGANQQRVRIDTGLPTTPPNAKPVGDVEAKNGWKPENAAGNNPGNQGVSSSDVFGPKRGVDLNALMNQPAPAAAVSGPMADLNLSFLNGVLDQARASWRNGDGSEATMALAQKILSSPDVTPELRNLVIKKLLLAVPTERTAEFREKLNALPRGPQGAVITDVAAQRQRFDRLLGRVSVPDSALPPGVDTPRPNVSHLMTGKPSAPVAAPSRGVAQINAQFASTAATTANDIWNKLPPDVQISNFLNMAHTILEQRFIPTEVKQDALRRMLDTIPPQHRETTLRYLAAFEKDNLGAGVGPQTPSSQWTVVSRGTVTTQSQVGGEAAEIDFLRAQYQRVFPGGLDEVRKR